MPGQGSKTKRPKLILQRRVILRCSNVATFLKKKPKILVETELSYFQCSNINFRMVRNLCRALKDAKMVHSLKVTNDNGNELKNKHLKHILSAFNHVKKLLLTYFGYNIHLKNAVTRIQRLKDLSKLELHFLCDENVKNYMLPRLIQQMRGLIQLKTLNLDFNKTPRSYRFQESSKQMEEPNSLICSFKFPRSLQSLSLHFQRSELSRPELINSFASNLSSCKSLKYLYLDCRELSGDSQFLELGSCIPVNNVQTRDIKKDRPRDFGPQKFEFFLPAFKSLKHLLALKLEVSFVKRGFSQMFADNFFSHVNFLWNLKYLSLQLEDWIPNSLSKNLLLSFQSLYVLEQFSLNIRIPDKYRLEYQRNFLETNECLQNLFEAIRSLQKLKDLKVCLLDFQISSEDLNFLSSSFRKLENLQSLSLVSNNVILKDDSLNNLYKNINYLKKLDSLTLILKEKEEPLTFGIPPSVERTVKTNPFISDFFKPSGSLRVKSSKEEEVGINLLFTTLNNLKLSTLNLNLASFEISPQELENLSFALRNLNQLSFLSLELPQSDLETIFFESALSGFQKLASLQLTLKGKRSRDKEVELFLFRIGEFSNLETLELNVKNTGKLTNRSLDFIQNKLRSLLSLRNVTLGFGENNNSFEKETVNKLFEALSLLKNLESVSIELPSWSLPSNFDAILNKFSGHKNLKTFTVNNKLICKINAHI